MSGLNPDELPAWFAIPGAVVLWAVWFAIRLSEERAKLQAIRSDFDREERGL